MLPALLLDIDGVLAPFGGGKGYQWHPGIAHFYSPHNTEHLKRLADQYRLVWATAWEHLANDRAWLDVLELEPLTYLKFGAIHSEGRIIVPSPRIGEETWKLRWIQEWAERDGEPLAWVDDDIRPDALHWADQREIPTLFLRIRPDLGLSAEHVEILLDWADTLEKE